VITVPELAAEALGSFLADHITRRFGSTDAPLTELIPSAARLALECIGNSDALYHNVEHAMLVTLAGYDIVRGRALLIPTDASDFAHLIFASMSAVFSKAMARTGMSSTQRAAKPSFRVALLTRHL
jgi:hypothetical protein